MAFIEMDFGTGGGGSLKTYATLYIKTEEPTLAGKSIDITFEDGTKNYDISPTKFSTVVDSNGFYNASVKVQSFGNYTILCEGIEGTAIVNDFNFTFDIEIGLYDDLVFKTLTAPTVGKYKAYSINGTVASGNEPYKAFDGNVSTYCYFPSGERGTIVYDFGDVGMLNNISLTIARATGSHTTSAIDIYACRDLSNYGKAIANYVGSSDNVISYTIPNGKPARYLVLDITKATGQGYLALIKEVTANQ